MFGRSNFASTTAAKSSLPPQQPVKQVQQSSINIQQLLQSIPDQEQLAQSIQAAFSGLETQLKNYPSGDPIAKGSSDLLKRVDREFQDLEKASQAAEILLFAVKRLLENQAAISADIQERKRVQTLLAVLQMDDGSSQQLDIIEQQLKKLQPSRQIVEPFETYVKEQAIELAKLLK
ncbi:hypothetical protein SS50377_23611 [Spironucleus salmonicida]|uniref:Uncharacterized protein n=1 Tax=Spironucleus salmonicida TaxID=348837 RepID=V6LWG7_9EUKA|nr:hypothetical protein SS50377_23611 [Spironucleus salmonicida]|eukprot:EST48593.1 Hypothetical protein SS50377_11204 [Spironucleus salmonicida]